MKKKSIQMELKLHKKKTMTPGDNIYILLITAFIHFSDLSFISYTNSLFPMQILFCLGAPAMVRLS